MRNIVAIVLLGTLASGCATGRMADLRDCGRLSIGFGPGLDAAAKVGCVTHPSIGIGSRTYRLGLENRVRYGTWTEEQAVWPVEILIQAFNSAWGGTGVSLASYERLRNPELLTDPKVETSWLPVLQTGRTPDSLSFHELTDVEVGATLALVSIRTGINPLEILDFLLGCVGLDIAKDDPMTKEKQTTPPTVPSPAPGAGEVR